MPSNHPARLLLSLLFCIAALPALARGEERPPNIIFIMADDLGYGELGCYGGDKILTPNIDRIAHNGMRFTYCYAGSAVCAPARDALMTGRHSGHLDRRENQAKAHRDELTRGLVPMPDKTVTVAEILKQHGYATGGFGKWGLGNPGTTGSPDKQGFDLWYGYIDQVHAHSYYTDYLVRSTPGRGNINEPIKANANGNRKVYSADLIHNESLAFIRANKDKPFLCYLATTLPHGKFEVPSLGPYADKSWGGQAKTYAAMVTHMDTQIGEVLDLLEELKIDENTIVFFTADHGPVPVSAKNFDGAMGQKGVKRSLHEGGVRVPMVVQWPGRIEPGGVSDFIWWHPDFLPTAIDAAGIADELHGVDGISILPTLLGEKQDPHDHFYFEFHDPFQQSVRKGKWKAIRFGTKEPIKLFNLDTDPNESRDLSAQHPEVVRELKTIMDNSRTENKYWPLRENRRRR